MLRRLGVVAALVVPLVTVSQLSSAVTAAPGDSGVTRSIAAGGTTSFAAAGFGNASGVQDPEFVTEVEGDAAGAGGAGVHGPVTDRSLSSAVRGNGRAVGAKAKAKSNPDLGVHFEGLNF